MVCYFEQHVDVLEIGKKMMSRAGRHRCNRRRQYQLQCARECTEMEPVVRAAVGGGVKLVKNNRTVFGSVS